MHDTGDHQPLDDPDSLRHPDSTTRPGTAPPTAPHCSDSTWSRN